MRAERKFTRRVLIVVALAFGVASVSLSGFGAPAALGVESITGGPGTVAPIQHWELQTSAKVQQSGGPVSDPSYVAKGWYPVGADTTVMAGMIGNGRPALLESGAGKLSHALFYGLDLQRVGRSRHFEVPWWYRTVFELSGDPAGARTLLRLNGVIPSADVWLNGKEIADHRQVAGAYVTHEIDITRLVHAGANALAIEVYPASPERDLSMSWIDWNPAPPDNNMGLWRSVDIVRTGPVALRDLHVISRLEPPGMGHAELTVKAELVNHTSQTQHVLVQGDAAGVGLSREVQVPAHGTLPVVFGPGNVPALKLRDPKVWWPLGMGAHPLYRAALSATVDHRLSDRAQTSFGIRDVASRLTAQGYRQFVINGRPLLIRGGGWAPDMFLREQPKRMAAEFRYLENLGLNAVRLEGRLERPAFFRLADQDGIMVLAGWECCSKWEAAAKTGGAPWSPEDFRVARESMASEARLLRDHPSVIAFLIGSDNAPPARTARMYVDALRAADWPNPIISAASDQGTEAAGPSGMKMSGPYAWVPPSYWYADKVGGAFGFNAETSAGVDIPRRATLEAMLTPQELTALWKYPEVRQYHASPSWSPFSSLALFDTALAKRYGAPKDLADYVAKAQLANYDNVRAQFEAYSAHMDAANPSTGVVYWMLNNAWPSLHWHLYGYYMNPAGAYFGAQKANQPVHIQYAYNNHAIVLVNHTFTAEHGLQATIRVRNLDGQVRYQKDVKGIALADNHTQQVLVLPKLSGLTSTYFVELELANQAGQPVSRNVYWLSTRPDVLDWKQSNWYTTPLTQYANLTALQTLPPATVEAQATTRQNGADRVTTVTLSVPLASQGGAFFQHVSLHDAAGAPVVPILWSSNDVTLWPGESVTLTARYRAPSRGAPYVSLEGWNVTATEIPAPVASQRAVPVTEVTHRVLGVARASSDPIAQDADAALRPWRLVPGSVF